MPRCGAERLGGEEAGQSSLQRQQLGEWGSELQCQPAWQGEWRHLTSW